MKRILPLLLTAIAACASTAVAQSPPAAVARAATPEARVQAYVAALSSDNPSDFEVFAQSAFTTTALAQRTPEARADMQTHIHGDFGTIQITSLDVAGNQATVELHGSTGLNARLQLTFEGPDFKIARAGIQVSMGGDGSRSASIPAAPINAAMNANDMSAAVDNWIAPLVQRGDFAGVVMVAHNGQPIITGAYGPAVRAPDRAATTQTAYNIASLGKRFTMTAVARLIQDGRLNLDTTIGDIIPDYPNAEARGATVRQLITMQGGIADIFSPERESLPPSQFSSNHAYYQFVSSLPQRFAPGSRNEYCNGCYVVLGEMIERITGRPFEDYVQRVVFTPSRMTRTGYFHRDRLPTNVATPYVRTEQGAWEDRTGHEGNAGNGAGGLYSTAEDLLRFDTALRAGQLLNTQWTGWVVGGDDNAQGRNVSALAVQGGAQGICAEIDSNGEWTVIVLANVQRPAPFDVAAALAHAVGA